MKLKLWYILLTLALCLALTAITAQAAEPVEEVEGNNSWEAAQLIPVNTPVQGTLATSGDVDYYKVELTSPGPISVKFEHEDLDNNTVYWQVYLYYTNGKEMISFNSAGSRVSWETNPVGVPEGTYYLCVQHKYSSDHTTAPYTLTLNYEASNSWETEYNTDFATADPFSVNSEIHGSLMNSGDVDYYQFDVENPGAISVSFSHAYIDNATTYWTVALYNTERREFYTYHSVGNVSAIETTPVGVPEGTYYVSIQHRYSSDHTSIPYDLMLNYTESSTWESEFNTDFATADLFPVNTEIQGALITSGDVDYFKFDVEAPGSISLLFNHKHFDNSTIFWQVTLYNVDGDSFYTFYSSGNSPEIEIYPIGVPVGTYYVVVAHRYSSDHSSVPYTLEMKYTKDASWEREFNNTMKTATSILPNSGFNGRLMTSNDVDCFTLDLTSKDDVSLTFKHDHIDSSTVYWKVTIQDEEGKDVSNYHFSGNNPDVTTPTTRLTPGKYFVVIGHRYSSDHSGIPYQFTVNAPNNTPTPKPEYELGDLIIRDMSGKALTEIPDASFMVTVPITKRTNDDSAIVMLAAYTDAGQMVAFRYVAVEDAPLDGTVKVTFPHDHSAGKIAKVKAFVVQDFNNFSPMGEAKEYPRMG